MMNNWKKLLPWIMVALALLTITINSGMSASITSIFDTFTPAQMARCYQ
jgi:hypothetical protein